ncbi:hypothetical protein BAUCODRAFT_36439 [Baudoinia panamericana UAMH 10762]|uniref:Opi1-domain-containing protein n=1 Tax=Baudoinia panamericana (strain UAMH 10762) TaxID=717646 RepID=M2LIH2_BAUPA|nr:uncharacterized protein BAUCODRAFT_36439 [Baudoinia panamericana UAMH 10762]EMC93967.1 hypothetical protein BAUCODRAFT_36439 [Baudoinia panamericana UAMH 10762]
METHVPPNGGRLSNGTAGNSPADMNSFMSFNELSRNPSNETDGDDARTREAAEALAGLGNPEFARSPQHMPLHVHVQSHASSEPRQESYHEGEEPMLQLLTQSHPWIGGAIGGSIYAYSTTKSYSPRFVRAGANMVERNIAKPVVSTVGSVGRMTGVEGVARWYLTPRSHSEHEQAERERDGSGRGKRRRDAHDEMDVESGLASPRSVARRDSFDSAMESLPPYGASKPPSYREEASPASLHRSKQLQRPAHNRTWSQQLVVSASGLSVAMSETSGQSLVYILGFLGRSAQHIATLTNALKLVLEQYDQARDHFHKTHDMPKHDGEQRPQTPDHDDAARRLAQVIKRHCDDIWQTLRTVTFSISNTVGGALPENAREFVRRQILSLPARWQKVSDGQSGDSDTSRNAHRMIAFATEGLDMMEHVGLACKATLDSAERWVQVVGRRSQQPPRNGQGHTQHALGPYKPSESGQAESQDLSDHAMTDGGDEQMKD